MPIPLLAAIAVGGGLGLLKNQMAAKQAAEERQRQAAIARYSPWTGMQSHTVQDPNLIGDITQGAASGAMLGGAYNALGASSPATEFASSAEGAGADTAKYSLMNASAPAANEASKYSLLGANAGSAGTGLKLLGDTDLAGGNSAWMQMAPQASNGGLFSSYFDGYTNQFGR